MAISYSFSSQKGFLEVKAQGKDDGLKEVENYQYAVLKELIKTGYTKVICDERELKYDLDTFDTYQLAKNVGEHARFVKKMALVCSLDDIKKGQFFEDSVTNRGVQILVTSDLAHAEKWLNSDH